MAPCAHAEDAQVVVIGVAGPLTGESANLGKDSEAGARLAVDELNHSGLSIDGKKITLKLQSEDDAADPRTATQVAQRLVDGHVSAVIGHVNSGCSIPASKIYNDAGIPELSPASSNPAYTAQGFKTTFRLIASDAQQAPAIADFARKTLKVKTVAIVDDATAYGQGLATEFEKRAKELGINVLSHDETNTKAVDFRAILTKIKAEKPDAIVYGGVDATGGPLARQARQLGIASKIVGGDGLCSTRMAQLAGDAAGDVYCTEGGRAIEKMNGGATFNASFKQRYGDAPQVFAPFSYEAVYVLADAMKRANSTQPDKILAVLPATNYSGLLGVLAFDAHGNVRDGTVSVYSFRNSRKTLIEEVGL
ncbi:branched-chain amino acid ABC transporter substrate-binding protein [Paraburkholderia sp. D15]|uniref:branched-chain amino acid ABC transporter substrate-binding protein n=1 Tax=Paraburkholderia sp. D15 TaxID=2880218 RepID=UPI00247A0821|nr:branched-chain amino acid ABC transporter substrate-binding protein [Paraburkholderia sp. D15]WGS51777.1 branched-chain amino acid ABC transporter substrate-binding protein [Paraburkholderia sp. D15]